MKKYIYALALLPMVGLISCKEDMGTEPGTDSTPNVVVYTYTPTDQNMNPDNDVTVRFATNSATTDVYYLIKLSSEVEEIINDGNKGENVLIEEVIANGTKISVDGAENVNVDLLDIHGANTICAVAVGKGGKALGKATFLGLDWEEKTLGTFYVQQSFVSTSTIECALEVCTTDATLYRLRDVFGSGYNMKMQLLDAYGEDEDGEYQLFRVPETATPWQVRLTDGNTYDLYVEDIGYWQNNSSFVTSASGYENGMYEDGSAFFQLAWMCDLGYLSYTSPSYFIPYE